MSQTLAKLYAMQYLKNKINKLEKGLEKGDLTITQTRIIKRELNSYKCDYEQIKEYGKDRN